MSEWIDKLEYSVNNHHNWEVGEKSLAINLDSDEPCAFEIEWYGDTWCSIGGEEFTHWHPLPLTPEAKHFLF